MSRRQRAAARAARKAQEHTMRNTRATLFAEISKVEPQEDGTLKVYGVASSEAVDSDGEIITAQAIKGALPEYGKFPALREMHQPIAAGTVIEASVSDDDKKTRIVAHVVDEGSIRKVEAGVLKGFSVRGPVTKRRAGAPHIIDGLKLTEISLVDRPANPEAVVELWKADGIQGEAKKSLYDVGRLAELTCSLNALAEWAEDEKNWEGDDSTVPQQLKLHARGLGTVLQQMVAEEVTELLGPQDETISKGDEMTDAQKAQLATLEQGIADLKAGLPGLGAAAVTEAIKAAKPEAPKPTEPTEEVAKAEKSALESKLATLTAERDTAVAERDELQKASIEMVDRLKQKGYLRVVEKGADTGTPKPEDEASKAAKKDEKPTDAIAEIRSVHKVGEQLKGAQGR